VLQVVCLNWQDYLGMGHEYVDRLRRMVDQHLTIAHTFTVVTEDDLPEGRDGWFNKLHLLEMFDGEVLYLDLDVDITGSVDHIVELARTDPSKIWARNDFSYPVTDKCQVVSDGYAGPLMNNGREATINSSVMIWNGRKDMSGVTEEMLKTIHGDQGIITRLFWPEGIGLLPEYSIRSYKYHILRGHESGAITVYHGTPKPHQVEGWA
jgi:hypothetical protein